MEGVLALVGVVLGGVFGLVGVVFGFGISAVWEFIRETRKKTRAKTLIQKELDS